MSPIESNYLSANFCRASWLPLAQAYETGRVTFRNYAKVYASTVVGSTSKQATAIATEIVEERRVRAIGRAGTHVDTKGLILFNQYPPGILSDSLRGRRQP